MRGIFLEEFTVQSDVRVAPWGGGQGNCSRRTYRMVNAQGTGCMENSITCETATREGQVIKRLRRYDSSGKTLRILNKNRIEY